MDNKNLNWLIFIIVVLIIIFASLALLYNSNLLSFLGLGKTQSSSNQIVVIMPVEKTGNSQVASSISTTAASSNTQDGGIIRLFYVSGQASPAASSNQPTQVSNTPSQTNYNTQQNSQQISYITSTYNYSTQQESYVEPTTQPTTNIPYSDNNYIPEKQVPEIQYIPIVEEKVIYININRESGQGGSQSNELQPMMSNPEPVLSSNLPGSNYNIPAEQIPSIPTAPVTLSVDINNYAFYPSSKIINLGDSVTWVNNDNTAHTVTSDSGDELGSGVLQPGESYTHTFNSAGTFSYHCSIHPFMTGVIIVSDVQLTSGHIPFLGNQQYALRGSP